MLSAVHEHVCLGQKKKAADCVLAWGGYKVIKNNVSQLFINSYLCSIYNALKRFL